MHPVPTGTDRRHAKELSELTQQIVTAMAVPVDRARYQELRAEIGSSENPGRARRKHSVEALTVIASTCRDTLDKKPYPVQVLGALCLGDRNIVEMATGEGKTITCALGAAWWALEGRVHVATANDYLARRDAETTRPLYEALGLTVAAVTQGDDAAARRAAYAADIVYATAKQFAFDYLEDRTVSNVSQLNHPHARHTIIVDEADSLMLDEAKTPLIMSRVLPNQVKRDYGHFAEVASKLSSPEDVHVDMATQNVTLTERGAVKAAQLLGLAEVTSDAELMAMLTSAIAAWFAYRNGVEYLVVDPKATGPEGKPYGQPIVLIDRNTGRINADMRIQNGVHESIEAREQHQGHQFTGKPTTSTTASITLPAFFAEYSHVAGMTGTAATDSDELATTYGTPVVIIPTHRPRIRVDIEPKTYATTDEKWQAIIIAVKERQASKQPILIGCANVEDSEAASERLQQAGIDHVLLNARRHEEEARIFAAAGLPGQITVATMMAGRGVDIALGGPLLPDANDDEKAAWAKLNDEVITAGGLCVIASTMFSSRRVDAQFKGRAGRQGEPGTTLTFASLQDEIAQSFAADSMAVMASNVVAKTSNGDPEPVPAVHRLLVRAQRRQESLAQENRKSVTSMDTPIADQRKAYYLLRQSVLESDAVGAAVSVAVPVWARALRPLTTKGRISADQGVIDGALDGVTGGAKISSGMQLDAAYSALAGTLIEHVTSILSQLAETGANKGASNHVVRRQLLEGLDTNWWGYLEAMEEIRADSGLAQYRQAEAAGQFAATTAKAWEDFLNLACTAALRGVLDLEINPVVSTN